MELIGALIVGILAVGIAALALGLVIVLFSILNGGTSNMAGPSTRPSDLSMKEGDFHSGPEGYSPNTAYPDTFYGSGGHYEEDLNR